jgi:hypothetical protein
MARSAHFPRPCLAKRAEMHYSETEKFHPATGRKTMIAYFVHDEHKAFDTIYLPDKGCFVPVDRSAMERFISVKPEFATWNGQVCTFVKPEEFGTVVASRDDQGDVCIVRQELWRERMFAHLGSPLDRR